MFLRERAAGGDDPRPSSTVQGASRSNYQPYETKGSGYFPTVATRVRRAVPRVVVVSYFVVSSAGAAPRATSDWGSAVRGDRRCAARGAASVEYVAWPTSCELAGRPVQRRAGPSALEVRGRAGPRPRREIERYLSLRSRELPGPAAD